MTCASDLRDRDVASCGQLDPEPVLWMTNGPLIRANGHAEASRTSAELAFDCHLDRPD